MRLSRPALALLALTLAGPALISAQDQPLAAGSEGVPVPKKKKHVQPVYPPDALAQGIRGIVILDLVIDAEGRVAKTTIIRSIPGLDEAALIDQDLTFERGQSLLVYTDGLTDAVNFRDECFDMTRVNEAVREARPAAPDMLARVVGDVVDFAGSAPQADDITLLALSCD